ncbi:MAG: discoidin domain-containing protein [Flavobacteriales bacterium]|nr:discoidin domain-containing protein [Flavobacteriales bacterium]MCB9364533.1 discoidin domain-containing protein [Flavobacteriales bacterium]
MKKLNLLFLAIIGIIAQANAQCDTTIINKAAWTISYVDSEEANGEGANNGHAIHCIDGDTSTFWHTEWQAAQTGFPHEIQINLGDTFPVNGFSLLTRDNSAAGKIADFEFYLSLDGSTWTSAQALGTFMYPDVNASGQTTSIYFGAIDAQYIKLVALTSATNHYYATVAEIDIYQDMGCGATGQTNQFITFNAIPDKSSVDAPFTISATASTAMPITYSIVSGPASIIDSTITLTGAGGTVTVKAEQVGNASYYSVAAFQSFEVINLATIYPTVTTKLTSAHDIEMPTLTAYPLYANAAINEPNQLSISGMEFEVNGTTIPATLVNGYYLGWWTPAAYGNYDVYVKAIGSNGNVTTDTVNVNVVNTVSTQNVQTFNGDLVNFDGSAASRWFYGTYTLPQSIGAYDQIIANFSVTCPAVSGGCDDWDRLAYVEYKSPNGDWMELFRYITPYGVACNHSIDVTDYASMLHGNIEIRMFIDTWGSGGWDLHLDFDYVAGTPTYLYSTIQEVWHGDYNFGNPANLQPCDTVSVDYPSNTQKATFRLTTTGHGWGSNNTGNAAEFYNATHNFHINGVSSYSQHLWNTCNPNPDNCTGQAGTWQYSRAGWCPGTIAPPNSYDFTSQIGNAPFNLAYVFQQSYQDYCHPNNPSCVSGTTCADCNDGYNPFYRVGAYMISFSNSPISVGIQALKEEKSFEVNAYPNPTNGLFKMEINEDVGNVVVTLHDISGATAKTYYFDGKSKLDAFQFDISSLSKGVYFLKVKTTHQSSVQKIILN